MNKLLAAALIILGTFCSQNSYGQLFDQRNNLSVGFNGGVNLSSIDFNPKVEQKGLMGKSFGVTARYNSEKYFKMLCGLQVEINYSQRGWEEKMDENSTDYYRRVLNYVEIPLLAHLAFGKDAYDKGLQFFINLGPSVAFLISEKEDKTPGLDSSDRPNSSSKVYNVILDKKFDYGLTGGAGLELSTKIGHFLLEGRYYFGLSDIFNAGVKDYYSRSANTYFGARMTYLFDLKR